MNYNNAIKLEGSEKCIIEGNVFSPLPTFEDLLDAIEWVESRGDANAVGDWVDWHKIGFNPNRDGACIIGNGPRLTEIKVEEDGWYRRDARAVGAYQLSEIYVDDLNRIFDWFAYRVKFDYEDRWDWFKSRLMVKRYIWYYGTKTGLDLTLDQYDNLTETACEYMARIHNGGPDGWRDDPQWFVRNRGYTLEQAEKKIENTKAYWQKVKARMENDVEMKE